MKEYYEQLSAQEFDNLDEKGHLLERYNLSNSHKKK